MPTKEQLYRSWEAQLEHPCILHQETETYSVRGAGKYVATQPPRKRTIPKEGDTFIIYKWDHKHGGLRIIGVRTYHEPEKQNPPK